MDNGRKNYKPSALHTQFVRKNCTNWDGNLCNNLIKCHQVLLGSYKSEMIMSNAKSEIKATLWYKCGQFCCHRTIMWSNIVLQAYHIWWCSILIATYVIITNIDLYLFNNFITWPTTTSAVATLFPVKFTGESVRLFGESNEKNVVLRL